MRIVPFFMAFAHFEKPGFFLIFVYASNTCTNPQKILSKKSALNTKQIVRTLYFYIVQNLFGVKKLIRLTAPKKSKVQSSPPLGFFYSMKHQSACSKICFKIYLLKSVFCARASRLMACFSFSDTRIKIRSVFFSFAILIFLKKYTSNLS